MSVVAAYVGSGCAAVAAKARGAGIYTAAAADIACAQHFVVAQGLREERQAEELIANGICEFFARRHIAVAVARHKDFDLGEHLENCGHADLKLKDVAADICTAHADGGYHRLDGVRNDGLIRDGEQYIAVDGDYAAANVLAAVGVGEEDIDGNVDLAAYTRKAGTVTQALDRQIADGAFRCG